MLSKLHVNYTSTINAMSMSRPSVCHAKVSKTIKDCKLKAIYCKLYFLAHKCSRLAADPARAYKTHFASKSALTTPYASTRQHSPGTTPLSCSKTD